MGLLDLLLVSSSVITCIKKYKRFLFNIFSCLGFFFFLVVLYFALQLLISGSNMTS